MVSEEVRVNVLNQPYGAFEWLGLPQKANTNWYNAHNFYGDLAELEAANLDDVKKFFDTYYAPNNAVLVVSGDTTPDEVMKLAEKHFGGIPQRPLPPRPDIKEPPQTAEKTLHRERQAGAHAGGRVRLSPARTDDQGLLRAVAARSAARQRREREAVSGADQGKPDRRRTCTGGFNYGLGNNFDYNGPMLYTFRVDYRPDLKGADVLKVVDKVISAVQEHGITEDELKQAKVQLPLVASSRTSRARAGFGRADLLAALALYDDDPNRINTILGDSDKVTVGRRAAGGEEIPGAGQPDDHRSACRKGGAQMIGRDVHGSAFEFVFVARSSLASFLAASAGLRQDRPAVGPERPFQLAPRVERTLPNGLRVIVTRQTAIPKVSITLTVLSGLFERSGGSDRPRVADRRPDPGRHEDAGTAARSAARSSAWAARCRPRRRRTSPRCRCAASPSSRRG